MKPLEIKQGSSTVRVYAEDRAGRTSYAIKARVGGQRLQFRRADLEQAKAIARAIASDMDAQNIGGGVFLDREESILCRRAIDILKGTGVEIDQAVRDFVEARAILGNRSIVEAAREHAARNPIDIAPVPIAQVIDEYLAHLRISGRSELHRKNLRVRLGKFARAFPNSTLISLTGSAITAWLASMRIGSRSIHNYRSAISGLVGFAKAQKLIPSAWDELDAVPRGAFVTESEIGIFTPAQIRRILELAAADHPALLPFFVIGAFCGLRTAEIERLEWSDIRNDHIRPRASTTKTRKTRTVPVCENAAAWIARCDQKQPVVRHTNLPVAVAKFCRKHGIRWRKNGLRHSYASYRLARTHDENLVASEIGDSPAVIHRHYKALVTEQEANEWFSLYPDHQPENVIKMKGTL